MTTSASSRAPVRARQRVDGDGRGFDQRARLVVDGVRQREEHRSIHDHAVGVATGAPGAEPDAVANGGGAHLLGAGKARIALAALRTDTALDAIAGPPAADALADACDGAGLSWPAPCRPETARACPGSAGGATDPAERDIDGDLPRPGLRQWPLNHLQQPILTDTHRAHGAV